MLLTMRFLLLSGAIALSSVAAAQDHAPARGTHDPPVAMDPVQDAQPCNVSQSPAEVIICGSRPQRYRIDPDVLAATRAVHTPPLKPPLDASTADSCVGPNCGGGMIPLVAMALTAIKAMALAAQGDDWRDAFRTHPDEYRAYEQSKARKKGGISIGLSASGN